MSASQNAPSRAERAAGILLHPTSLPGPYGIGDLGPVAHGWVETLAGARQRWWQILPTGPTGYGDSPYACFSAFAGNPYLVSPDLLIEDGLLNHADLDGTDFDAARVDYGPVIDAKTRWLRLAWERFAAASNPVLRSEFEKFSDAAAAWLDDYALFMALKESHDGASWLEWDALLRHRDAGALAGARARLRDTIDQHRFQQFLFFRQWHALREHAHQRGVRILGDVPIFVASDSADVWSHPEFFRLDADRRLTVVAGVPPDYFSATGQLWGNPLYDWRALGTDGYRWWIDRLRTTLELVDRVRIDHFRGFEAYWEVPAGRTTAEIGAWIPGPGAAFFEAVRSALGDLPILAEDLGVITPEVDALRERFGLPGMRVLQFAFGGEPTDRFLPHQYEHHTTVYTGTHDNDTTLSWYTLLPEKERAFLHRYLGRANASSDSSAHSRLADPAAVEFVWDLIRLAWSSVADTAIVPLQDVLGLGSEARLNIPAVAAGNWSWRVTPEQLVHPGLERLRDWTELYARA